jgi:hypothetical protein
MRILSELIPTRGQLLWTIRIAIAIVVLLVILSLIGLPFGITLWSWLQLLAVPTAIGAAVPLLNWLQKKRELDIQHKRAQDAAAIEHQRAQDAALQDYLDQIGKLLLERDTYGQLLIRKREEEQEEEQIEADFISALIRSRTLTLLAILDSDSAINRRKGRVLQFLYESGLIRRPSEGGFVNLYGDAKTDTPLPTTPAQSAADLSRADLHRATLEGANLSGTRLSYAFLTHARLMRADLNDTNLFHTDLSNANLSFADLTGAALTGADLTGADLTGANLTKATVTQAQLDSCKALEDATMTNGQKYEDWRKDIEDNGEHGENGRSS